MKLRLTPLPPAGNGTKRLWPILLLSLLWAGGGLTAAGAEPETNAAAPAEVKANAKDAGKENASPAKSGKLDRQAFKLIAERNIFDPNRSARSDRRSARREPERRTHVESFTLTGTMSYEKGRFAFFDGESAEFRQVLQASDSIAGYKLTEVRAGHVTLQGTNGAAVELPVGKAMRRHDQGQWSVGEREETNSGTRSAEAGKGADGGGSESGEKKEATASGSSGGGGGAENEILKKLLQNAKASRGEQ